MRFLPRHVRRPDTSSASGTPVDAVFRSGFRASDRPRTSVLRRATGRGRQRPRGTRRPPCRPDRAAVLFVATAIVVGGFTATVSGSPLAAAADSAVLSAATPRTTAARTAPAQLAAPSPSWPKGVDVASWQHPGGAPISWTAVRDSGVSFAFVKATEGSGYTNPYFAADRRAAAAAGLVVGAYHYARPALPLSSAADQARRLLDAIGDVRVNDHFAPVLDLETTGGLNVSQLAAWASTFLEEIETHTGRAPILYTNRWFWTDLIANSTAFSRYPLWFAIYNSGATPGQLPGGWQSWAIWQHSRAGQVPGIKGNADVNVLCCTASALATLGDGRHSELAKRYATDPAVQWVLGPPTKTEGPAGGGGRWQRHRNGLLFWSVTTGALEVHGSIGKKYIALGGSNGFLRRPLTDETDASAPQSRQSVFQGGRIYWSQATGAFEVHGAILSRYLELGGSGSLLGLPLSDEYSVPGGRQSTFQHGLLRWDAATGNVDIVSV